MKKKTVLVSLMIMYLFAGCAQISVYDNYKHKGKPVGIKHYQPKPFILVSYTGMKDNPVKTEIVYLPDLAKPKYAVMKSGFGASSLKMSFENGMLTSVGQESSSDIPETISSFAELLKNVKAAEVGPMPSVPTFELYEIVVQKGVYKLRRVEFE